ncbi:MAG: RNA polymerase factor sigma-32 [Deltaproteobacteria bacterium]|jgi:RNA polymerase sigma-32 factor|nr:MAG: RNA polymerase factor sigma-32 [Deltaproteobacteria bacterium]
MAKKARKKKEKKKNLEAAAEYNFEESYTEPLDSYPSDSLIPYDPLKHYLMEIKRYPLLSREEEQRLSIRYREKGDMEAAYRLITSNLRLVVKIALSFQRHWMRNLMDLIQEGNIGLMQAVKKFDPYRGYKLSYYASFWIKAYIIKFIMDNWKLVKIGTTQAQRKLFFNLRKEKERLLSMGFEPAPKLLAERLDVKESEVIEMDQRLGSWEVSLDAPIKEDSDSDHQSFIPSDEIGADDQLADFERKEILTQKLASFRTTLPEKERFIFDNRLMAEEPLTLQEIGDLYGISRERVRQIQVRITKKIKTYLQEEIEDIEDLYSELL